MSAITRLFFIGLWTQVDREGRCEDRPARLKAALFPYDDVDAELMILELIAGGFVKRYKAEGKRILCIPKFTKHQNPHFKESASILPEITTESMNDSIMTQLCVNHESSLTQSCTQEGKGRERKGREKDIVPSAPEAVISKPKELTPQQRLVRYFKEAKGVNANDTDWDRKHWNGRLGKEANAVLKAFDGDVKKAGEYILVKGEEWKHLPDWGLNGIVGAAGRDPRLNGENNESEHLTMDAIGLDGTGRHRNFTSSREIAGDALAGLRQQAALSGPEVGDVDGPGRDSPDDGPFET